MRKYSLIAMFLFIVVAFFLHLLAMLKIFPLIISIPLLFISIFIFLMFLNNRKRFKGF